MTSSIIIPSHNTPLTYFDEMIKSLEQQTMQDFNVIVIDDGSKNRISYSGPLSLTTYRFEENRGIVSALNKAIELVDSDIILRMDADDICSPNRVEQTIRFLEENPEIDFGCTSIMVKSAQQPQILSAPFDELTLRSVLPLSNPIAHPSSFFRASVLKGQKYVDCVRGMEDYFLWFRLMRAGVRFGSIQETLLTYRKHDENWTQTNASSRRQRWIMLMKYVWANVHPAPMITSKIIEDVSFLLYPEKEKQWNWLNFLERMDSAFWYAEGIRAAGYKHPPTSDQIKVVGRKAIFQKLDLGATPCFHRDIVSLVSRFEQLRYFIGKR